MQNNFVIKYKRLLIITDITTVHNLLRQLTGVMCQQNSSCKCNACTNDTDLPAVIPWYNMCDIQTLKMGTLLNEIFENIIFVPLVNKKEKKEWHHKLTRAHTHIHTHIRTHIRIYKSSSYNRPRRPRGGVETRYPFYRRLGEPQGRSGQVRKISPPPGFDPRTVE